MQSPSCSLEEDPESGASFGSSGEDNNKDNKDKDEPPPLDCSDDRNKTMKDRKSEKKRKSNSNSNSNSSRRLLRRRRHNNHDNEYEYEQKRDNDNNSDKNDRRIKRYLQRFHKGITDTTDTDTAADDDDEINNNNNINARPDKQKIRMILLKDCLHKLLLAGAGISEISSCLFLASSNSNHDAVTLILEQITKWNTNNTNTKKKQHKNKKHSKKHKNKKNNNNNIYNSIDIDDLINGTNNNSSDSMLSPLHIACLLNNGGMAYSLVQYGANKYARDANGETPFDDLGVTELITQYENSVLRTEAKERAHQRDHSQQQELQQEQTVRDMEWSKKLADVEAQDQMQHGTAFAEQKFGTGWDDNTTNDVLNEVGGHSDGDWWSRIAKERKQKKQKHQRRSSAEKAAASAFAARSGNNKRSRSNISGDDDDHGGDGNGDGGKSTNNESSGDNKKKESTAGTTTGPTEIIIIDPIEARAIDNRAWSAFMEKWSATAAVVVSTNKTTTLKTTTTTTTTEGAGTSSPSSSSSLLLVTETKVDDPVIMQQRNRRTMMTMTDVPWPYLGDDTPFPGGSQSSSSAVVLTPGERKVYHRQLIRRWHPDKFLQRFHSHLQTNEKEEGDTDEDNRMATRILKRVTAVFQSINNNNNNNTY